MLNEAGSAASRHHVFIAGTGRAGTSFLVEYLAALGLETHLDVHAAPDWHADANAGFEDLPGAGGSSALPYVIKSPWLYERIDDLLDDPAIVLDALILPVRDLAEASASRSVLERQTILRSQPWMAETPSAWETWGLTPGGTVYSLDPRDQARLLAVGFHHLVERAVKAEIPILLMHFPRLVQDADYLFDRLRPVLGADVTRQQARDVHSRLADPGLDRAGPELRAGSGAMRTAKLRAGDVGPAAIDRLAMGRELKRVNAALARGDEARLKQADETAALRLELTQRREEAERLNHALLTTRVEAALVRNERDALRNAACWRLTAPLRSVFRRLRGEFGGNAQD